MFGVINDICERSNETLASIYKRPESIIVAMWHEYKHLEWMDRGKTPTITTSEEKLKEFERLKREAGADL